MDPAQKETDHLDVGSDSGSRDAIAGARRQFLPPGPFGTLRFHLERIAEALVDALQREWNAGRGFLWVPVAVAVGIALYFALPREPMLLALFAGFVLLTLAARRARSRPILYAALVCAAAAMAGVSLAKLRTDVVVAPILDRERTVTMTGAIETVEQRSRGVRLVLRTEEMDKKVPQDRVPDRVRVTVARDAPHLVAGSRVTFLARLRPPQGPVMPGGYDFGRALFFEGIGATGFAYGTPKPAEVANPTVTRWAGRARNVIETFRAALGDRLRETLPGASGEVAAALVVGDRGGIPQDTVDALRQAGLAHILAISGMHMALVTGAVFWVVRALLALIPGLALRQPIRKWAAVAALATGAVYLIISGAGVATQRAFVMVAVVLLAVLVDRPAVTMRSVALAALAVMVLAPEMVTGPSFQMSFAAVVALIATYEWVTGREKKFAAPAGGLPSLIASRAGRYILGLALTSLVAGLATAPLAAFHFHRVAPFGLLANLLAMPVVALVIMPAAVASMLAAPFGLDPLILPAMGWGIDTVIAVAGTIADLTPKGGVVGAMPQSAALAFAAGLLWLCLWRTRLRWGGVGLLALGALLAPMADCADVLISEDGKTVAVRRADSTLAVHTGRGGDFVAETWLRADGDSRSPDDPSVIAGIQCDPLGCILPLPEPGAHDSLALVALSQKPLAFLEDCTRAAIVVAERSASAHCSEAAIVSDRATRARTGALALTLKPRRPGEAGKPAFEIRTARPRYRRPWNPEPPEPRSRKAGVTGAATRSLPQPQ